MPLACQNTETCAKHMQETRTKIEGIFLNLGRIESALEERKAQRIEDRARTTADFEELKDSIAGLSCECSRLQKVIGDGQTIISASTTLTKAVASLAALIFSGCLAYKAIMG
jgi:hypothetical protein